MGRRIDELAFDREVGVYGDHGFRAQALFRAAGTLNNARWALYRNDAWPNSDIGAHYLAGETTLELDGSDGWYAEVGFVGVDAGDTERDVVRQIRRMTAAQRRARSLGGYFLCSTVHAAHQKQDSTDARYAATRAKAPWMVEHPYTGDYAQALWARRIPDGDPPFPASFIDSPSGVRFPLLVDLRDGHSWLTEPAPAVLAGSEAVDPHVPASPVRLRATRLAAGENALSVSQELRASTRAWELSFAVGAREDICRQERGS